MNNNKLSIHRRHKTIDLISKNHKQSEVLFLTLMRFFLELKAKIATLLKGEKSISSYEDNELIDLSKNISSRTKELLFINVFLSLCLGHRGKQDNKLVEKFL